MTTRTIKDAVRVANDKTINTRGVSKQQVQLEEAIRKILTKKALPPKSKHERTVIIESWNERGASGILSQLFRRPLDQKQIECLKTLIVVHKLLRQGHPQSLIDTYIRRSFLDNLRKAWQRYPSEYGAINAAYLAYLLAKLSFHNGHKEIEGSLSVQKYADKHPAPNVKTALEIVTHLLDLQQACLTFQARVFKTAGLNDLKVACFIPLVIESYDIYKLTVWFLKHLVTVVDNIDVLTFLTDRFYTTYPDLRKFYQNVKHLQYVSSQIAVPTLSGAPPKFEIADRPPPRKQKQKKRVEQLPAIVKPVVKVRQVPVQQSLMDFNINPAPLSPPARFVNPIPQGQVGVAPAKKPVTVVNPFLQPSPPKPTVNPINKLIPSVPVKPTPAPPKSNAKRFIVKPGETRADLLAKIAALEGKVKSLTEENTMLRAALAASEKNSQEATQALEEQNNTLRIQLESMQEEFEEERRRMFDEQIDFAAKGVAASLYRLDEPEYKGNQHASAQDLLDAAGALRDAFKSMMDDLGDGGENVVSNSKLMSDITTRLIANGKGYSDFIEDPSIQHRLLDALRGTGEGSGKFLNHVQQVGPGEPEPEQLKFLDGSASKVKNTLSQLESAVKEAVEYNLNLSAGENIDDIAERELLEAARVIEMAAKSLEMSSRQRSTTLSAGTDNLQEYSVADDRKEQLQVSDSIMAAALAITKATQILAAANAQAERKEKGRVAAPGQKKYMNDPMWAEGLISAAKSVAAAVHQLVEAANATANGEIEEAALIAASKFVAQATVQLVAATRSKSDPGSKTQSGLDNAAKAVKQATSMLVDAARKAGNANREKEVQEAAKNWIGGFAGELEIQTKILELEEQIKLEHQKLRAHRKSKYANAQK